MTTVPPHVIRYDGKDYPLTVQFSLKKTHDLNRLIAWVPVPLAYPTDTPLLRAIEAADSEKVYKSPNVWAYLDITYWHPTVQHANAVWGVHARFTPRVDPGPAHFAQLEHFYNTPTHPAVKAKYPADGWDDRDGEPAQFKGLGRWLLCVALRRLVRGIPASQLGQYYLILEARGDLSNSALPVPRWHALDSYDELAITAPYAMADFVREFALFSTEYVNRKESGVLEARSDGTMAEKLPWDDVEGIVLHFYNDSGEHFAALANNRRLVEYYHRTYGLDIWQGGSCQVAKNAETDCTTLLTLMGAKIETVMGRCEEPIS